MKKNLIIAAIAGAFLLPVVACGPSAEEKLAKEQAMKDSIAEVERLKIQAEMEAAAAKQAEMDSIANAAKQAVEDSIAAATAAAEKAKPKASTKPKATQPKTETAPAPEAPKVGKKKPGAN
ncbi:MAG: hypothetical protein RL491_574 [Bacteroidota bacterium]|jgi:hypothetical protein